MKTTAEGNSYVRDVTESGVRTFRHVATGEVLHGQVGPWKEAWQLYVTPAGLATRIGEVTVWDLGLGCGAQLLACLEAFLGNPALTRCDVLSFDLEKDGLTALLEDKHDHAHALSYEDALRRFIAAAPGETVEIESGGRVFRWRFVGGDIRDTIDGTDYPPADFFFYDFFSSANYPWLWRRALFSSLRRNSTPNARLITYASATAARSAIAAGGFYLGLGIPSGRKVNSTVGACRLEDLDDPLPNRWRETFLTSHKPFLEDESDAEKAEITRRIREHPQFRKAQ